MKDGPSKTHYYELYRSSTLGLTLTESLDDMIHSEQISPQLARLILAEFDKQITVALNCRIKCRATFKGYLSTYRYCDDVWTFFLKNCQIRVEEETLNIEKLKIVSCNSKRPGD